jgi:hypothetical protein
MRSAGSQGSWEDRLEHGVWQPIRRHRIQVPGLGGRIAIHGEFRIGHNFLQHDWLSPLALRRQSSVVRPTDVGNSWNLRRQEIAEILPCLISPKPISDGISQGLPARHHRYTHYSPHPSSWMIQEPRYSGSYVVPVCDCVASISPGSANRLRLRRTAICTNSTRLTTSMRL